MSYRKRRTLSLLLSSGVIVCTCGLNASWATTLSQTWGSVPADSGPRIFDWQVAYWIDKYFEDGSKNDGSVDSNIAAYFVQCFGGDWLDNFDSTAAGFGDSVEFTVSTIHSANEPGKLSFYAGYHDDVAEYIAPFSLTTDGLFGVIDGAHEKGVEGKHSKEDPQAEGINKPLFGTHTHVLIYAGIPLLNPGGSRSMQGDIDNIVENYADLSGASVTVLAGDGTGPYATGAATRANLESALQSIGAQMDDGANDQFILFVGDHGGLFESKPDITVAPLSTAAIDALVGDVQQDLLGFEQTTLPGITPMNLATSAALADASLLSVSVSSQDESVYEINLGDPQVHTSGIEVPDPQAPSGFRELTNYEIPFDSSLLLQLSEDATIILSNAGEEAVTFDFVGLGTGAIPMAIPEPSTLVLITFGILAGAILRGALNSKRLPESFGNL